MDFKANCANIGAPIRNLLFMNTHNCKCGECDGEENIFRVNGENLLKKIKELIHEGNVRKIVIKDDKGKYTYLEIPVTIGVIGTVLLPVLAAVGALAAMVGWVTVEVIKTGATGEGAGNAVKGEASHMKKKTHPESK